jgi:hypothetical protein
MFEGILQLGDSIKIKNDNVSNYIYVCFSIENPNYNNEFILMGSNDKDTYFDYKLFKPNEDNEQVYRLRNVFKYYKLVNAGPVIKGKISIFSR